LVIPLDKKAVNEVVDSLKEETATIGDPQIKKIFTGLFDLVELLASENEKLTVENQQLKNEVNELKGEQGKPDVKPNKRNATDISSEKERKDGKPGDDGKASEDSRKKKRNRKPKLPDINIDREHKCEIDQSTLPSDVINKGFTDTIIVDIKIVTDNVRYRRETYYSPSQGKTFIAPLPVGVAGKGEFGVGVRSLIPLFKSECHLPESAILTFFKNFGIQTSAAYLSKQWTDGYENFNQEKEDIVTAGIANGSYQQIDDTGARVNGNNHYTHVLCNPYYSAFFTTERKDRLTVLDIFRNFAPREFIYNDYAIGLLEGFKLPQKCRKLIEQHFDKNKMINERDFDTSLMPIKLGSLQQRRVKEACAIAAYRTQTAIPIIGTLISDDAPQFKLLTETLGLCWVHDGRHYKKLNPIITDNKRILDEFLTQYWAFYRKLNDYKATQSTDEKKALYKAFDTLFATKTEYGQLNERIAKTLVKRAELLVSLEQPQLPLHNNASELAARVQARARDVSLHTKSAAGTKIKDSLMTISQTAKKLGVNTYEYILDRVSCEFKLPSLAELIQQKSQADSAASPLPS
jgi:regulator of replication initiation timing